MFRRCDCKVFVKLADTVTPEQLYYISVQYTYINSVSMCGECISQQNHTHTQKKIKLLKVGDKEKMKVFLKDGRIEQVKQYSYLGSLFSQRCEDAKKVSNQVTAKSAFNRKKTTMQQNGTETKFQT